MNVARFFSKKTTMIDHKRWIFRILVWAYVYAIVSANLTDSSEIDLSNEMDTSTTTKRTFPDRCLVKTEPGPCKQNVQKWTFIKTEGKCRTFLYGGCLGNENRFNSEVECLYHCVGGPERKEILCLLLSFIQLFEYRDWIMYQKEMR